MPNIKTSRVMAQGLIALASFSPSSLLDAQRTVKPSLVRYSSMIARVPGSSSTTSTGLSARPLSGSFGAGAGAALAGCCFRTGRWGEVPGICTLTGSVTSKRVPTPSSLAARIAPPIM